jgi:hypothetical protein
MEACFHKKVLTWIGESLKDRKCRKRMEPRGRERHRRSPRVSERERANQWSRGDASDMDGQAGEGSR